MNAKIAIFILILSIFAIACTPISADADRASKVTTYIDGRGENGMLFVNGEIPADADSFTSDHGSVNWISIRRQSSKNGVNCIFMDGDVMTFGVPIEVQKGQKFECGASDFEVLECFDQGCTSSIIGGFWRTGLKPDFGKVPLQFIYNECLGITSISFANYSVEPEGIGTSLELRNGLGLLANPNARICQNNPISELLGITVTGITVTRAYLPVYP